MQKPRHIKYLVFVERGASRATEDHSISVSYPNFANSLGLGRVYYSNPEMDLPKLKDELKPYRHYTMEVAFLCVSNQVVFPLSMLFLLSI